MCVYIDIHLFEYLNLVCKISDIQMRKKKLNYHS